MNEDELVEHMSPDCTCTGGCKTVVMDEGWGYDIGGEG